MLRDTNSHRISPGGYTIRNAGILFHDNRNRPRHKSFHQFFCAYWYLRRQRLYLFLFSQGALRLLHPEVRHEPLIAVRKRDHVHEILA